MDLNKQKTNVKSFLIKQENEGIRIDKFLKTKFPKLSRNLLQKLIKQGLITVNTKKTKANYRLRQADKLKISLRQKEKVKISPNSNLKLNIIFENKDFLVVDKPAGLLTHPAQKSANATVASFISSYLPSLKNVGDNPLRPGIVHRLDKDTSGILLIAKNQETFIALKSLFKERKIQKTYIALVFGWVKKDKGKMESYIVRSSKNPRKRTSLPFSRQGLKSKKALTYYNVNKRLKDQKGNRYALLNLKIKTGRTHQIRAQFASINHPIVGDPLYKIKKLFYEPDIKRMFLHAKTLAFCLKNRYYQFTSPLPQELKLFLDSLKECRT